MKDSLVDQFTNKQKAMRLAKRLSKGMPIIVEDKIINLEE